MTPLTDEQFGDWLDARAAKGRRNAAMAPGIEGDELMRILRANLPETPPPMPYELTEEGARAKYFATICPKEFSGAIETPRLANPAAFTRVCAWDGSFPGPLAFGRTGTAKTRAAWACLRQLHIKSNRSFAWFPVRRLVTELTKYEERDCAADFYRWYGNYSVLFVDDLDKINWSFDSESQALFQFYDWIYRANRPCITTTNKDRAWWAERMGEPFARRLFEDAHRPIAF